MLEQTRPEGDSRARGLVSGRRSGSRVEVRSFAASGPLADLVASFWVTRWDLRGQPSHRAELIADPCVNFAFEAGASRVVGVSTRLFRRDVEGAGVIRAVKLRAGAARAFLPKPVYACTDRTIPFETVFSGDAQLIQKVLDPEDDEAGLAAMERWLEARIDSSDANISLACRLAECIRTESDLTSVAALVERSGLGLRPLQRLFREYLGVSPKWAIRQYRLQELAVRLERCEGVTLATLAAELGYSDHAHLTRDFKAATGRSPKTFASEVWK